MYKAEIAVGMMLASVIVIGGVFLIHDSLSPTFALTKSEWVCSKEKIENRLVYNAALKMSQLVPETICEQWSKR